MRNSRPPKQAKTTPRVCQALTVKLLREFSWQLLLWPFYRERAVPHRLLAYQAPAVRARRAAASPHGAMDMVQLTGAVTRTAPTSCPSLADHNG
jgi:hypothetical protein